jgi:hypothetical protein
MVRSSCPKCGRSIKSPAGLRAHMRKCDARAEAPTDARAEAPTDARAMRLANVWIEPTRAYAAQRARRMQALIGDLERLERLHKKAADDARKGSARACWDAQALQQQFQGLKREYLEATADALFRRGRARPRRGGPRERPQRRARARPRRRARARPRRRARARPRRRARARPRRRARARPQRRARARPRRRARARCSLPRTRRKCAVSGGREALRRSPARGARRARLGQSKRWWAYLFLRRLPMSAPQRPQNPMA